MPARDDLPSPVHGALELERQRASARARLFGESAFPIVGDRYAIRARLGSGAMGIVYRAHDRLLDRDVALKLVRPTGIDRVEAVRRARKEARSLARLHHPNVVEVFDVGVSAHGLHIAMELVRGRDLGTWTKQTDADWRQRLQVCLAAGRGLAAAHAVGIVHRDIKPGNVLVADDGRVLVVDFGLAKAVHVHEQTQPSTAPSSFVDTSTIGSIVGTPRYMAPEQHAGAPVDPRTDQFSFCATVHEILVGAPAFTAKSLSELEAQKRAHAIVPAVSSVPTAVLSTLARGMRPDPDRRWPSMDDLLAALDRATSRRRTVPLLAASIAATTVLVLALALPTSSPCSEGDPLVGIWDASRRDAVESALRAEDAPWSDDAWQRVHAGLDAYADAWRAQYGQTCERSDAHLDLRMACLRRARAALASTTDVLARADTGVAVLAPQLLDDLPSLQRCDDATALLAEAPPPDDPSTAEAVAQTRDALARAAAQRSAGAYRDGLRDALALRDRADAIGHAPLQAEVALEIARGHWRVGDHARAEEALRDALALALGAGALEVAARAAAGELFVVGYLQGRTEDALRGSERAIGLARASSDADALESTARTHLGRVLLLHGDLAAAEAEQRRALDLHVRARGPDHPGEAPLRDALAEVLAARGEHEQAAREQSIALRLRERALGAWHPAVASSHHALGVTVSDPAEAIEHLQRALEIRTRGLGADHMRTIAVTADLAAALLHAGREQDARLHVAAALTGTIALGEEAPFVRLGRALQAAGQPDSARAIMQRVVARHDDTPRVASTAYVDAAAWLRDNPDSSVRYTNPAPSQVGQ